MPLVLPRAPFVGRAAELTELQDAWRRALAGEPRLALIGGEAGIGKTSLVHAFVRDLPDDAIVLTGQCVRIGGLPMPYAPIASILEQLARRVGVETVRRWAGNGQAQLGMVVPDLSAEPVSGQPDRLALFDALASVLEAAAAEAPVCLVLEDLHAGEQLTWHLLQFLQAVLPGSRLLLIATYRSDELPTRHPLRPVLAELGRRPGVGRLELRPMPEEDLADLVRSVLPEGRPALIARMVERSDGVPYFAEELARGAQEGRSDLPSTLAEALLARVYGLSETASELMRLACGAGLMVSHELLEALSGLSPDDLDAALRETVDAALLVPTEDGYAFRHGLLREVIHDKLLPGEHVRLHSRVADALIATSDPDDPPADLAHHLLAANRLPEGFEACRKVVEGSTHAHLTRLRLLEHALEVWDRDPSAARVLGTRSEVLHAAAEAARSAGEPARALPLIEASLKESGPDDDPLLRAERLIILSRLRYRLLGQDPLPILSEALALTPADRPTTQRAEVLEHLSSQLMLDGRLQESLATAEEGLPIAREVGATTAESSLLNTMGCVVAALGDEVRGLDLLHQAGSIAEGRARTRWRINYSNQLHLAGRFREAADVALLGVADARALGVERSVGVIMAANAAESLLALGDPDEAVALVEPALALNPPSEQRLNLRLLLAEVALVRGNLDEAEAILGEFLPVYRAEQSEPQDRFRVGRAIATFALLKDQSARAWEVGRHLLTMSGREHPAHSWQAAGLAARALRLGAGDLAADGEWLRERTAQLAPSSTQSRWRTLLDAELTDTVEAWRRASEAFIGGPVSIRLDALIETGKDLVAAGSPAADILDSARTLAVDLGAEPRLELVSALQRRAGLVRGPAAAPGLTPREHEVLTLLMDGASNGEIARKLFVSTKTVSVHVSNILAKLGVASRGAAAAKARREGW